MDNSNQDDEKKGEFLEQSQSRDREVITIGLGTCGNRMSTGFWRNILDEHNLDFDGTIMEVAKNTDYSVDNTRIGTYFRELREGHGAARYVPHNLICDLDVTTIDSVRAGNLGSLFNADSYIYTGNSAQNLYSLGYSSLIIDDIMEEIRSMAEKCSSLQGFTLLHAVGGGTGSGVTAYLAQLIKQEYYDRIITSYTVYPSSGGRASDIVIEPYNMMLSLPSLLKYHDVNCALDNETLYDISTRLFHHEFPAFKDLNEYICNVISSSTAGLRFPGSLNMDLRKLAMNLVPFPRLKFMSICDAPLMSDHSQKYTRMSIETLINELFHSHQFLCNLTDMEYGKYLAASVVFRGAPVNPHNIKINEWEMAHGLRKTMDELLEDNLVQYNCNILHSTLVYQSCQKYPLTGTLFANNTSIKELFERNMTRFLKFWQRKAHLQYYTNNGTLEADFHEAISDCKDLIQEYNDKDDSCGLNPSDAFEIDTANRKKLKKNKVFWKKLQKKPMNRNKNKRVVIMSKNRRKQLALKAARKKRIEEAKRKRNKKIKKNRKKKKRRRRRRDSSDSSDDEERSSSSSSSSSSDSSDDSSSDNGASTDTSSDSSSNSNDTDDNNSSDTSSSSSSSPSSSSSSSDTNGSSDTD
eukprot:619962_1